MFQEGNLRPLHIDDLTEQCSIVESGNPESKKRNVVAKLITESQAVDDNLDTSFESDEEPECRILPNLIESMSLRKFTADVDAVTKQVLCKLDTHNVDGDHDTIFVSDKELPECSILPKLVDLTSIRSANDPTLYTSVVTSLTEDADILSGNAEAGKGGFRIKILECV